MAGSVYGKLFRVTTWGESHGSGLGVVVDGCPAGLELSEADIQVYLNRRRPGQSKYTTPRQEADTVELMSGVFAGKTTGMPISMIVRNHTQRSSDYSEIAGYYRPGHADYTFDEKYGFRDYRGGGRSSGRETIGRVAAGAIAAKILQELGVKLVTYTKSIGEIGIDYQNFKEEELWKNALYMPDSQAAEQAAEYLENRMRQQDSAGGVVECVVTGVPAGIGEPVFDKLDANLAKALVSIGAVKGFEIGDGMAVAQAIGSVNNDAFCMQDGQVKKKSNHAGGTLGGISDGSPIVVRAAFKPTPSILREQNTVTCSGEDVTVSIPGRHDPIIVPRAVVVVEAMVALTLVDGMFENMSARLDRIREFYS